LPEPDSPTSPNRSPGRRKKLTPFTARTAPAELPAFLVRSSGLRIPHRADDADAVARIARIQLERGAGMLVCVPIPEASALPRAEMERELSGALGAPVSVKATTNEGMGFVGREEGAAALAVATVLAR